MATMKTVPICNIRRSYDDWKVIGTRFDGLVFRMFLSENCYTWNLQDRIISIERSRHLKGF